MGTLGFFIRDAHTESAHMPSECGSRASISSATCGVLGFAATLQRTEASSSPAKSAKISPGVAVFPATPFRK